MHIIKRHYATYRNDPDFYEDGYETNIHFSYGDGDDFINNYGDGVYYGSGNGNGSGYTTGEGRQNHIDND